METREVAAQPAQGFIGSEVTLGIDRSTHRLTLRLLGSAEDRAANRWYGLGTPLSAETVRMIAAPPEVRFSRLLRRRLAVIISSDSPQVSPPKSP